MINALEEIGLIRQCFRKMSIYQDTLNPQQNRNNLVLFYKVQMDDPTIQQVVDKYLSVKDLKEDYAPKKGKRQDQLQTQYQLALRNRPLVKSTLKESRVSCILLKVQVFTRHFEQLKQDL